MSQFLPAEFDWLDSQIAHKPAKVVVAFRYELALLLVEQGRLSQIAHSDDAAHFRTNDGSDFELPDPHLPAAQAKMVQEHLRWLVGL